MEINWILLTVAVFGLIVQLIAQKTYNLKIGGGAFVFSASSALFAALFFVISSGGRLSFNPWVLLYSLFFAIAYSVSIVGLFLAIKTGPLSLTALITSYSLLIPTFYGLIALKEPIKWTLTVGLILLFASLTLINLKKGGKEKKINGKWIIFILLAFLGNGACSVIQKMQQASFAGEYKSEFMIFALITVFTSLAAVALFAERSKIKKSLSGWIWFIIWGFANGTVNLIVMILTGRMNVSVMFPVISGGEVVLTFIISRFFYKEKLTRIQDAGFVLGVLAVIMLNI